MPAWTTPAPGHAFKTVMCGLVVVLAGSQPARAGPVLPWRSPDAAIEVLDTPDFMVSLQAASQTLVSLAPKGQGGFDFAPSGRFTQRLGDGNYRLGDIDLRVRPVGTTSWADYSSAFRRKAVTPMRVKGALAAADITASLDGIPLKVTRTWRLDKGRLVLSFTLSNPGRTAIEIGGLGLPMIFDNIVTDRTLDEAHEKASFTFGWIGFGGTVSAAGGKVMLSPRDSARTRVFVAPAGLWLTLDAGKVRTLAYDPASGRVDLTLEPGDAYTPIAYVDLATTTANGRPYGPVTPLAADKGAFAVKLGAVPQTISFSPLSR